MRIVAGLAKGRRLGVPARGTRPTSDRAREAMFSALTALVDFTGSSVLDLFAGTGAVGLEALSRRAGQVTFVESDPAAARVLARNIAAVGLPGAHVRCISAEAFLAAVPRGAPYRLIFADPPYGYGETALTALLADAAERGEPGAVIVVERSARGPRLSWPDSIEPVKQRQYGEGLLWYGRRR
jgi:16S rRNA (guanine966-N2)-methyltransferase